VNQSEDRSPGALIPTDGSRSEPTGGVDDPRLVQALEEYRSALDAGRRPDRQAFLARHPEIAEALADCLDGLEFVHAVAPELSQDGASALPDPSASAAAILTGTLGDFRILREVGRGGMGVVYEAEQISLGRRVALKVLPFASAMDAKQLQRFKNEAQAAAHLQHQHIVPVYYVGCERGVHFYAMPFIEGQTLAKVIADLRLQIADLEKNAGGRHEPLAGQATQDHPPARCDPQSQICNLQFEMAATVPTAGLSTERSTRSAAFFRTVANLGVEAAEALEHAHQMGVIHRDIKPGNLMVDAGGHLWVTDFGLARLATDASLTMTGDLLGTLRYMSPEQALAKRVVIDHRTDVYSLGVTLYELLVLEPAYNGRSREEVLRQIAFEEPRPPRRLNRSIPAELETIVLKAIAKNPEERYATAQELADDLKRFLEDKPIKAKRPSLRQRAAKWARRHRTVVRAAMVVLALAVAGLAVGATLIWQKNQELSQSLERERQSLECERQNAYYHRIALAEREWSANNLSRAEQLLDACPADLRGWEWYYLKRLRYKTFPPLRHEGAVLCATISPDGQWIASSGHDGFVRIWNAKSGKELLQIPAHKDHARGIAFSADGQRLASVGWDGAVKVWDAQTGRKLITLAGHTGRVWGVAFSPDGQRLASAGRGKSAEEGEVKIWELATGRELLTLTGSFPVVYCVSFSPDGRRLAFGSRDKTVNVWDAQIGKELLTFRGHTQPVFGVAFSPDGRRLASAAGGLSVQPNQDVKVWDAESGEEILSLGGHVGGVAGVTFSPDGRRLASGGADQTVKLWDLTTGQECLTLRGHLDSIRTVAFSHDGHRLVSASDDRTVRVWDATPLAAGRGQELLTLHGHSGAVFSVAFSPDGQRLASAGVDQTLKLWDAETGKNLATLHGHRGGIRTVAFSPDGRLLATAGSGQNPTVGVWEVATAKEIAAFDLHTEGVRSVAFSPDSRHLASAGYDFVVRIWDVTTGKQIRVLQDHNWPILGVAFSPDGRHVASASADSTVRLWDWTTGQELRALEPKHGGLVASVAFSRDGKFLASGSWDRTIKIWDAQTWKLHRDLRDPTGGVQSVAFNPDGRRLVWGSADGTVKVWDDPTGDMHLLRGHTNRVESVAFSPDGQRIASASLDGTVKLWLAPE
jgi:WD40 repeat protein/serine/threonine protein kinase